MSVDRRKFLKTAGGAAAWMAAQKPAPAQSVVPSSGDEAVAGPDADVLTTDRTGSDFMTDVLKTLNFEYVCANPGSSFRALQESLINYGGNKNPEWLTCCHEESAVGMGHGYAKVEGKPLLVFAHGTVGLQHAAMAIYNAFCDRVPVYIVVGNHLDAVTRKPMRVDWVHSVQDAAAMVREFIKWDDLPVSLPHFAESAVRAYKIAMTPPMAPVLLVADGHLQESPIATDAQFHVPKLTLAAPPQGDSGAVAEAARLLAEADAPVIVAGHLARTAAGMRYLIGLAETLQAPVIDQNGRMNFPSRHALNQSERAGAVIANADVILGLELIDFWGTVNAFRDQLYRTSRPVAKPGAKLISITSGDLYLKSNYQNFERFTEVDLAIAADAEATMPALIEEVKRRIDADRKRALQDRGAKLAAERQGIVERVRAQAVYAWDESPISTARVSAEVWAQIKDKDWSLVSDVTHGRDWPLRMWNFDTYYRHVGGACGEGLGYGAPSAVGAALANRKHGRFSVNLQTDGDLLYAPIVLWTAAHHRIPLLNVMINNHAYLQETMHIQRMEDRHSRGITNARIGTAIENPNIDYAKFAESLGLHSEGPISDPKDLAPALRRAIAAVERGEPALVDVVTQPR